MVFGAITLEMAKKIINLRADSEMQARIDQLAANPRTQSWEDHFTMQGVRIPNRHRTSSVQRPEELRPDKLTAQNEHQWNKNSQIGPDQFPTRI